MNSILQRGFVLTILLMNVAMSVAQEPQRRRPRWRETLVTDTPMVHDPVMAEEAGTYYLFATGGGIQMWTSPDRRTWTLQRRPALPQLPAWTQDSVPGFRFHVWAPDVIRFAGRWWMAYSCSTFGRNTSAIGLASSPTLDFRDSLRCQWRDEGCIVASRERRDQWNAIDPNFIIDDEGQPWLTWGSFWDGIQLARLDTTMHLAAGERPRTIARRHRPGEKAEPNPTSKYAGTNAIEAPFIFHHGDYYYLLVSWDYCCRGAKSTYKVVVGRSRSVSGPYIDRDGRDMADGGGTLLIEGDKVTFEALGHCAAYHFDGRDIFICHGYSIAHGGQSILVQRDIQWTYDGWPALQPPTTPMPATPKG